MIHYNYQSDFKIVEPLKDEAPFRFTYYIKEKQVIAEYDGDGYTGCIARDGELVIPIEGKSLGLGEIKVKREYFLADVDFRDGVCNLVTIESTGIELWHGASEVAEEVHVEVSPAYHTVYTAGGEGVQSDWAVENPSSLAYIKNKPTIPTKVEDLTDAEAYAKKTDIPTKVSELDNDRGYLTEHQSLADYAKKSDIPTDYAKASDIPTKTSQLTNDAGYATMGEVESMIGDKPSSNLTSIEKLTEEDYNSKLAEGTLSDTTMYVIV